MEDIGNIGKEIIFGRSSENTSTKEEMIKELEIFMENFVLLLRNEKLILEDKKKFYCEPAFAYIGQRQLSLGVLFLLWKQDFFRESCPHCQGQAYITGATGSPLSGSHSIIGFCPSCQKVISKDNTSGFIRYLFPANRLMKVYPNADVFKETQNGYFSFKDGLVGKPNSTELIKEKVHGYSLQKLIEILKTKDTPKKRYIGFKGELHKQFKETERLQRVCKFGKKGFFILSAFKQNLNENKNLRRHKKLKEDLKSCDLKFFELNGVYEAKEGNLTGQKEVELSLFVPYQDSVDETAFMQTILELGVKYNIESIFLKMPISSCDNTIYEFFPESRELKPLVTDISQNKLIDVFSNFKNASHKDKHFIVESVTHPDNHINAYQLQHEGYLI